MKGIVFSEFLEMVEDRFSGSKLQPRIYEPSSVSSNAAFASSPR